MYASANLTLGQANAPPASGPVVGPGNSNAVGNSGTLAPAGTQPAAGTQAPPSSNPFGGSMIFILLGVFVVMMIFSSRSGSKEKKKRAALLAALKKGDKVSTIGGVIGTIAEVRDNEVVLKVDENTNTRIKYLRSAIQGVIEEKSDPAK